MAAYTIVATGLASSVNAEVTITFASGTIAVEVDDVPGDNLVSGVESVIPLIEGEVLELICSDWDVITKIDISIQQFLSIDVSGWQLPTSLTEISLNSTEVEGDISGWTLPVALTDFNLSNTEVEGDISGWSLPTTLEDFRIQTTNVEGDIGGWSLPNGITYFRVSQTSVSGNIGSWTIPSSLEEFWFTLTSVSGDISGWDVSSNSLKTLRLTGTSVSGDISGWSFGSSMHNFYLGNTSVSGDIGGWTIPASMDHIGLYNTGVSGDISGWSLHVDIRDLLFYNTSVDYDSSGGALTTIVEESISIRFDDCSLTYQQVDNILADLAASGVSNGDLDIDGTNSGNSPAGAADRILLDITRGWNVDINAELVPPTKASNESPADAASGTGIDATLSWTKDGGDEVYVYFDKKGEHDPPTTKVVDNLDVGTYDPPSDLEPSTAYVWRVDTSDGVLVTTGDQWEFTTAALPTKSSNESPSDDATDVAVSTLLSWSKDSGDSVLVYIDKKTVNDPPTTKVIDDVDALSYDPPSDLVAETIYVWRVDTKNETGTTTGDQWEFTTVDLEEEPEETVLVKGGNLLGSPQIINPQIVGDEDISGSVCPQEQDCDDTCGLINVPNEFHPGIGDSIVNF